MEEKRREVTYKDGRGWSHGYLLKISADCQSVLIETWNGSIVTRKPEDVVLDPKGGDR